MIPFAYSRPDTTDQAVQEVSNNPNTAYLAGGTNLVDHLRLGVAEPDSLVDISGLPLDEITELADGVSIGATVKNSELARHPLIRRNYPALARALLSGASAQLRNVATTGGNLLQRTRCPYFQDVTTPCNKREPGTGCSAVEGHSRDAAIFATTPECIATHPSDMAVALAMYDAIVDVQGPDGVREVPLDRFYSTTRPDQDTVLDHGELIIGVRLPTPPAGRSTYRKVRDRQSFAFALASVAVNVEVSDGVITAARVACGGVAPKPWRAHRAEAELVGKPATDDSYSRAADKELELAEPLAGNAFKVDLLRGVMIAALDEAAGR